MNLALELKKIPDLDLISRVCRRHKTSAWLTGGFLRDIHLKRHKKLIDFDFCIEKNTLKVVNSIARAMSSKVITLDDKFRSYRIVVKNKGFNLNYDFNSLRAKDIITDLSLRDFSINSLAVEITKPGKFLIDAWSALEAIKKRTVKVIRPQVISIDPLRIIRGFVFSCILGFKIDKATLKLISTRRKMLKNVAGERIAQELFKIFDSDDSFETIKLMDECMVLQEIIPLIKQMRSVTQGSYHHLDVWGHSLETLKQFEVIYRKKIIPNPELKSYFEQEVAQNRSRKQVIKLACLLHDIGKPKAKRKLKKRTIFYEHEKIGRGLAEKICVRLKLSARETDVIKKLIFWHLRPGYLADQITPSKKAVYHFFRDTQDEGITVIILSLSDWRATRGPLTNSRKRLRHEKIMLKLIDDFLKEKKRKPLPKLLDGYDIMKKFKLSSGPLIGEMLKKVREEQCLGRISSREEAFQISKTVLKLNKK
ncbi:MAG: HD domain-containing protein [Candidatus Omnitrophica bacterium]|nr:HD domain-containing protein [Candidatus Omnitrophota bacterium]